MLVQYSIMLSVITYVSVPNGTSLKSKVNLVVYPVVYHLRNVNEILLVMY